MEKIFFIDPFGDNLTPIMSYLSDVAECMEFSSVMDAIRSRETPDVILFVADGNPEHSGEIFLY